jgi:hypothetical protein
VQDGVNFTDPAHSKTALLGAQGPAAESKAHDMVHCSKKSGGSKGNFKGSKEKEAEKGSSKAKKSKRISAKGGPQSFADATEHAVTESHAREWAPTRTGHLAVGARETGVKVQFS